MPQKRSRSENLTDEHIEVIVSLLDGWASSKLTWSELIDAIDFKTGQHYTRQALSGHTRIKKAYDISKKRIAFEKGKEIIDSEDNMLIQKIQKLEAENMRLKQENQDLLEQYAKWAYNAYTSGLTIEDLDRPLAKVNRNQDV